MNAEECSLPKEAVAFSYSYNVAHHLCSQVNFHCILCHMGQMDICKVVENVDSIVFVPLVYNQNMFPLSSYRKQVVYEIRLNLHIVFEEQISSALQEVWRIIHCHNILILNLEEWLPSGSTQQFQGLDNVGMHVSDATTCSPAFWPAPRSLFKNLINRLDLVLPWLK